MMQMSTLCRSPRKHHTYVNDTGETLITDMLKNAHQACETLEETKSALEKVTLAAAMESKVTLAVTTIRNKIQVTRFLLICYK